MRKGIALIAVICLVGTGVLAESPPSPTPLAGYSLRASPDEVRVYATRSTKANIVGYLIPGGNQEVQVLSVTGDWCYISYTSVYGVSFGYVPLSCFDVAAAPTPTPRPAVTYEPGTPGWIKNIQSGYRLNLREEPSGSAKSLGKYYTGTPVVLTVPHILQETFQANDDYYISYLYTNLTRWLRVLGFVLTITLPAIYVALLTWHQEMIPTRLLFSIAASRQGVPFTTFTEAVGILIIFEILKEAGTRTPETIGQALSIVGGLVLGQAAVEARFASAPMVIVIAFSGVTALIVPKLRTATLLLRFFLLICAAILGLYGILLGLALILAHVCRLTSFGIPYLTNILAAEKHNGQDVLFRFPWFAMKPDKRFLAGWNEVRR